MIFWEAFNVLLYNVDFSFWSLIFRLVTASPVGMRRTTSNRLSFESSGNSSIWQSKNRKKCFLTYLCCHLTIGYMIFPWKVSTRFSLPCTIPPFDALQSYTSTYIHILHIKIATTPESIKERISLIFRYSGETWVYSHKLSELDTLVGPKSKWSSVKFIALCLVLAI